MSVFRRYSTGYQRSALGLAIARTSAISEELYGASSGEVTSVTQGSSYSSGTTVVVNHPSTVNAGDRLIYVVMHQGVQDGDNETLTPPAGLTQLYNAGQSWRGVWYVGWKIANGTEGGTSVNFITQSTMGGSFPASGLVVRVRNVGDLVGFSVPSTQKAWDTQGITTAPSVTAKRSRSVLVSILTYQPSGTANVSKHASGLARLAQGGHGAWNLNYDVAYRHNVPVGSTGDVIWSGGTSDYPALPINLLFNSTGTSPQVERSNVHANQGTYGVSPRSWNRTNFTPRVGNVLIGAVSVDTIAWDQFTFGDSSGHVWTRDGRLGTTANAWYRSEPLTSIPSGWTASASVGGAVGWGLKLIEVSGEFASSPVDEIVTNTGFSETPNLTVTTDTDNELLVFFLNHSGTFNLKTFSVSPASPMSYLPMESTSNMLGFAQLGTAGTYTLNVSWAGQGNSAWNIHGITYRPASGVLTPTITSLNPSAPWLVGQTGVQLVGTNFGA